MDDLENEDLEYYQYRINFIQSRLLDLYKDKEKLVSRMIDPYTKTDIFELKSLNQQIEFNQALIIAMDDGQEYFQLEN